MPQARQYEIVSYLEQLGGAVGQMATCIMLPMPRSPTCLVCFAGREVHGSGSACVPW